MSQTQIPTPPSFSCFLPSDEAGRAFGALLAPLLQAGDVLLLNGHVGAGKTHLSRALIQHRLGYAEDVPSPTFTLVQLYEPECGPEIWHADLYRLSHPDEVSELGLEAAFETAICLIEWPERLGELTPAGALTVTLQAEERDGIDGRHLTMSGGRADLIAAIAGAAKAEGFHD